MQCFASTMRSGTIPSLPDEVQNALCCPHTLTMILVLAMLSNGSVASSTWL